MIDSYFDSENFTKVDFTTSKIQKGEYDNCIFKECNFLGIYASNIQFVACKFIDCNFNNTIVKNTAFIEIVITLPVSFKPFVFLPLCLFETIKE